MEIDYVINNILVGLVGNRLMLLKSSIFFGRIFGRLDKGRELIVFRIGRVLDRLL